MWEIRRDLSDEDLQQALELRREIFVREQEIPAELDEDGLDDRADHVLGLLDGRAVATGRLALGEAGRGVLARIAVRSEYRGLGLGKRVVEELERIAEDRGLHTLTLHPHRHLERFYQGLGYDTVPGTDTVGKHELIKMRKRLPGRAGGR